MRPPLNNGIQLKDFQDYYWLKEELQQFCRENGLSVSGSKIDITNRITIFLETGKIIKPTRKQKQKPTNKPLTLSTIITEGHTCSQNVRHFFKQHIPNFHFSTAIQNYFKENVGNTYKDAIQFWYEEEQRLKDPSYHKKLAPQFEYNQFIKDYFAHPQNNGKTRLDAIKAWNEIKALPGDNKFRPV